MTLPALASSSISALRKPRNNPFIPNPHNQNQTRRIGKQKSQFVTMSMSTTEEKKRPEAPVRVVVCGGGVVGVCTAFFLARKGAAVTVVEKSSVACAASGKAGGFLALDWCDGGPLAELVRASFHLHRSLAAELEGPRVYGYRPLRTLSLSLQEVDDFSDGKGDQKKKKKNSSPEWVDGPLRSPPRVIGTPETTAQVHPQLFTRTLLSTAVAHHGVELIIGEVEEIQVEGGRATGVFLKQIQSQEQDRNQRRILQADCIVLALGPWSSGLPLLSSLFRVSGLKAHSIVLRPREPEFVTPDALFLHYYPGRGGKPLEPEVYPRPNGEVYLCGMSEEGVEIPDDPEQVNGNPESIRMLHRVAERVSSHLRPGEAQVQAEQACFLPCTEDGRPVIGEMPNIRGCYVATGHNCWGILNGPATGAALAELILDGHASIVDLTPFTPARFVRR
ncbi:D-amino-acid oxidase [Aristolochia californica]|uniref:D-amino-acid oxidase n=1 Tax=Aristolochia californica TaxID=171875 RepID=UPI0035E1692A